MRFRFILGAAVLIAFCSGASALQPDARFELSGTWIGWAWLGDTGDLPIRLRLAAGGDLRATFDSPAHRYFGARFEVARWERPELRLEGHSQSGSPIAIEATLNGHGESGGKQTVPFETTARDAVAAVEMLKRRDDLARSSVGLFGMSRGGWHAPLAASMSGKVEFLILLVPPAVSPAAQETRSRLDHMKQAGFGAEEIDLASRLLESTWRWIRESDGWDEYSQLRARAVQAGLPDYVLESDDRDSEEWTWGRMNMFFEPCPVLSRLDIPVLAIFGGKDVYVSEAINRRKLGECIGKEARLTIRTIEGAEHSLAVPNGLPIHRQTGQGDEGFSMIADWALATVFDAAD